MFKAENIKTAEMLEEDRVANKLAEEVAEAKKYLNNTDFKMTVDYFNTLTEAEQNELTTKRVEARAFVRENTDPLFFKVQRGEIEESVWLDEIQKIKDENKPKTEPSDEP